MDRNTKHMIDNFRKNPAAAQALLQSKDGQQLLQMLTQNNQGGSLQNAVNSASRGNPAALIQMISNIRRSPEGEKLVERINKAAQR